MLATEDEKDEKDEEVEDDSLDDDLLRNLNGCLPESLA